MASIAEAMFGKSAPSNEKIKKLEQFREKTDEKGQKTILTTNQGVPISDNQNSLHAGPRGPTLLEDFIMREKITHFDHERIPERVVHARGAGAHGYFEVFKPLTHLTKAKFLQDPSVQTPVFVRFSTVGGSKGSMDTPRDVRGFATKFYTEEGNFDLVGNNFPVFFVQDAMKFPDFVHAVKPEPHWEIPQAASAHDNLWDFVTQQTETLHTIMWLMSDRGIPRSYSTMEGFGVHTFRLVNEEGVSRFVKFHWKPVLGVHSLVWDEATKITGADPDFNRRELWESIEAGHYPEWELGIQVVEEADERKFDFDLLDPTKLIPEELVPVQRVGRMVLNRNPDNFFCETEQVAFCVSHIVPGIDFTNDLLMQGRLFSYLDTQISRLGGANFHEIPINRPICPFKHNNQRDGMHRQTIHVGKTNYDKNGLNKGLPREGGPGVGFSSYAQRMDGAKIRQRSESFADHFSQATMFWKSMSPPEQDHIVEAFSFELAKVREDIREGVVAILQCVDAVLAQRVATNLGITQLPPKYRPDYPKAVAASPALSQLNQPTSFKSRQVAILAADGVDGTTVLAIKAAVAAAGGVAKVIAPHMGNLNGTNVKEAIKVDATITGSPSVLFDAVYIPGGAGSIQTLLACGKAVHYVTQAFVHYKPIGASGDAINFLNQIGVVKTGQEVPVGVIIENGQTVTEPVVGQFIQAVAQHRFYNRKGTEKFAV
ncbi:catalase HPII-like [Paramacrobiotus metropolitanus]|uniref:catalase HPII-like n=1 Tax=Paramacrobiotus metropolitanus TaxID=2943436 RepID=UPI0024464C52|nr:catalase HPII-like [Paramacrobiotus metropolitanus]